MKNIILWFCCLLPTHLLCADNFNDLISLSDNDGRILQSGEGAFVHRVCKYAIDTNTLISNCATCQSEFAQAVLMLGQSVFVENDSKKITFEKIYFTDKKNRRDTATISEDLAISLITNLETQASLRFDSYIYSGSNTLAMNYTSGQSLPRTTIISAKSYIPRIHQFGRNNGYIDANILKKISDGVYTFSATQKAEKIVWSIKGSVGEMPFEVTITTTPGRGDMLDQVILQLGATKRKITCDNYVKTKNNFWFPQLYREETTLFIGGVDYLVSSEEYIAVNESVDFETKINDSVYNPIIPFGAIIFDSRESNPKEKTQINEGSVIF